MTLAKKILVALNKIKRVFESISIITINGPTFWRVAKIAQPLHVIVDITIGIHWMKGNNPIFIIIPKEIKLGDSTFVVRKDVINIAEPLVCIKKYFITDSVVLVVILNSGMNPNKDSSNPIQVKNQLFLLMIIIIDKEITRK